MTGLRVLMSLLLDPGAQYQLAQLMMNMSLITGYALLTPALDEEWSNMGVDSDGLPLLGIISTVTHLYGG